MPQMWYFGMTESDTIDVGNPWDIDKMLDYQENKGERGMLPHAVYVPTSGLHLEDAGLPPNNQYNLHNGFYCTFWIRWPIYIMPGARILLR